MRYLIIINQNQLLIMKTTKFLSLLLIAGVTLVSCEKDTSSAQENASTNQQKEVSEETLAGLASIYLNTSDVQKTDFLLPDGKTIQKYLVGGDIVIDDDQIQYMQQFFPKQPESGEGQRPTQYRTYNLVSPSTINVIGFTGGGGQGLTSKEKQALQYAIDNYNALNLGIDFTLNFGTNYGPYDIVVYQNPNGQAGGVAGFPQNGQAYKWVQIFSGMNNYSVNTIEHVMTHEIGHAVGLRHTDWSTRESCGQSGESAGQAGAVHIPGTPYGYDATSVMLACFGSSEDGEFGYYDKVALDYLY